MPVGDFDGLRAFQNRFDPAASFTHPANDFMFRFDGFCGGELTAWHVCPLYGLKLSCGKAGIEIAPHLGIGNFAHSAAKPIADQRPFIDYGFAFKVLVTREGQRFANLFYRINWPLLTLLVFARLPNHGFGLVPEFGSEFAVRGHHLAG